MAFFVFLVSIVLLFGLCVLGICKASPVKRIGKSKLYTWLPGIKPMRYELEKYAQCGYEKVNKSKQQPFLLDFFGHDYLMLPPKYIEELRRGDAQQASFERSFSDALNISATVGDLYLAGIMEKVTVKHLGQSALSKWQSVTEGSPIYTSRKLRIDEDWKSITAAKAISMIVHRVTNLVLVGQELSRSEDYIETSQRFSSTLLPAGVWTNFIYLGPLRNMFARWTTFFHRWELEKCVKILMPVIQERLRKREKGEGNDEDAIQWTIDAAFATGNTREIWPRRIAENVLHLLFAANSAPGALATQMLYQLLMDPGYLEPLRDEIRAALAAEGGWNAAAMDKMALLDSFVRETVRMYPPGSIACTRTIQKVDLTFRDGMRLPVNSRFAFPVLAIQMDPDNYHSPRVFDGYRFVDRLADGSFKTKVLSTTVTPSYLALGYGKHACPGRFFGILKAKLVFAKLITNYELKWPSSLAERPPNVSIEGMVPPNQQQVILVRNIVSTVLSR
ncbi:uncharacterized protein Z518_00659 [Rhinocladiella mackenziei CBS 650.93]|uniref:Cytochrome P450 n=1 Tax=Rhinocladiella mackenziei CBS 650.93 TaxID=1442369 RepID=A0A0D2IU43_9EURO|nr:uncharacterized protein Z518_00659 [Rhinocladiella mackenziei CBS 650.93]KIX09579.1 hypothetical protein Z518_00659 [Rhinocladiella mackenziei CBS 650.93]